MGPPRFVPITGQLGKPDDHITEGHDNGTEPYSEGDLLESLHGPSSLFLHSNRELVNVRRATKKPSRVADVYQLLLRAFGDQPRLAGTHPSLVVYSFLRV